MVSFLIHNLSVWVCVDACALVCGFHSLAHANKPTLCFAFLSQHRALSSSASCFQHELEVLASTLRVQTPSSSTTLTGILTMTSKYRRLSRGHLHAFVVAFNQQICDIICFVRMLYTVNFICSLLCHPPLTVTFLSPHLSTLLGFQQSPPYRPK